MEKKNKNRNNGNKNKNFEEIENSASLKLSINYKNSKLDTTLIDSIENILDEEENKLVL